MPGNTKQSLGPGKGGKLKGPGKGLGTGKNPHFLKRGGGDQNRGGEPRGGKPHQKPRGVLERHGENEGGNPPGGGKDL